MFKDLSKIKFQAGNGGDGHVSFDINSRPSGGIGGKGGDVYLEGTTNLDDLSFIKRDFLFKAEDGENGSINNSTGRYGKDLVLKVPLVTHLYDLSGKLLLKIDKAGEKKLFLKGGIGGAGNFTYKAGGFDTLKKFQKGKTTEIVEVKIELELYSDIIFIGFPNAGKSSILNSLTNAEAKVASYAFTTIIPQLGRMDGVTLMDLPGLIEKTSEGKGLGTAFVKHTRMAKYIAHFISLEDEDLIKSYNLMQKELELIDAKLSGKPEIIVLTKSDLITKDKIADSINIFNKLGKKTIFVSVYDYESLEALKLEFKKAIQA